MDEKTILEDIRRLLVSLPNSEKLAPVFISQALADRMRAELGDAEVGSMIGAGQLAIYKDRMVIVEDVDEFKDWGHKGMPTAFMATGTLSVNDHDPEQLLRLFRQFETMATVGELSPSPRHPAHNAPNRRRFKRNSRKR